MEWNLYKKHKPNEDGEYWCKVHWHNEPVKLILRIESDWNENTMESVYWMHWFEDKNALSKPDPIDDADEPTWWCDESDFTNEEPYAFVIESYSDSSILYIAKNIEYAKRLLETPAFMFETFCIPVFKNDK